MFSNEFVGSELALSIDITFMFDCIIVPDVSISAIAKYLLSFEMLTSTALVDDKYVLNSSFPCGLYIFITVL